MSQIGIAKKILEQGSCMGISCEDDNCPFYKHNLSKVTDCLISIVATEVEDGKDMDKVKQWLKEHEEKEMIDLTKNQIVEPAIRCWVKNEITDEWKKEELYAIDHRYTFYGYRTENDEWKYCTLIDPTLPTKRLRLWTHIDDVPFELWVRALVKDKSMPNQYARILNPNDIVDSEGNVCDPEDLVYLPLTAKSLHDEWLPFGNWS